MIREVFDSKTPYDISLEWDAIIKRRSMEIEKGHDKSFTYILLPAILRNIKKVAHDNKLCVIDCGCGSGEIIHAIEEYCEQIIGIDISAKSIEIAKQKKLSTTTFYYNTSIEEYSEKCKTWADVCIFNMVLSNVVDCSQVCKAANLMLKVGGKMLITIPHPCYWPQYWNYDNETWFDYKKQLCMTSDFCITGIGTMGVTTHIHRPLEQYIQALIQNGFNITSFEELYSDLNKGLNNFQYPRFIYIEAEKGIHNMI